MSKGLKGEFNHFIDAKGRLIVPFKLREQLGLTFVVTRGQDGCLDAYPNDAWEEFEARIDVLPSMNSEARSIQRFFRSGATDVEIDNQGRILLPQTLRDFAKIEKEVVIVGNGHKAEIWSKDKWEEINNIDNLDFNKIASNFESAGLSY